jgi:S1-C subfamily serine protease
LNPAARPHTGRLLNSGDVIVALGDSKIEGTSDVQTFADSNGVGTSTKVSYFRAGTLKESTLVVGERPRKQD